MGHTRDTFYMHARVEVFVPGTGWLEFDPTNNFRVEKHYIKVAHGVDYQDCSPKMGVLKVSGSNETNYQVEVHHMEQ